VKIKLIDMIMIRRLIKDEREEERRERRRRKGDRVNCTSGFI
jgi:hypothetical protein